VNEVEDGESKGHTTMVLPFWKLRVENLTLDGSDGLPTDNSESGSDDGRMIFADGDVILYTPDNGDPLPGIVVGFDGTKYHIKLDNGTEMTVDERCLVRHNRPGDTSSSPFGSSDESKSSMEGIKMKPWQNNANCTNSDSETETEIDDAPKFCKGQWLWYRQDDEVPFRGRVTRDSLEKQDVHIILYNSGAKRVCRQKFVVADTPPPEFVQSDTKHEAASDIARKKKPAVPSTGGVRQSSRKTKPVVKPLQVTRQSRNTASNNRSYEHNGERFSYKQMERWFCKPFNSTIKEPKYYKTIEYVGKPGIDLSKTSTHDVKFCYCTKCDEIVEYRAGYYKGIQQHYLERHATKKEKDKMAATASKGKATKARAVSVKAEDMKASATGLTTGRGRNKIGPAASDEAKALAAERKMRRALEKRLNDLEKNQEKFKKGFGN
jgi:hypothetical protein